VSVFSHTRCSVDFDTYTTLLTPTATPIHVYQVAREVPYPRRDSRLATRDVCANNRRGDCVGGLDAYIRRRRCFTTDVPQTKNPAPRRGRCIHSVSNGIYRGS